MGKLSVFHRGYSAECIFFITISPLRKSVVIVFCSILKSAIQHFGNDCFQFNSIFDPSFIDWRIAFTDGF